MSSQVDDSLKRLQAAIGCPNRWSRYEGDPAFRRTLLLYWAEVATRHQAFNEMSYYGQLSALIDASADILERIEKNAEIWRDRAIAEYRDRTSFFDRYNHLDERQHAKHWTVKEQSRQKLADSTRTGPAKYVHRYPLSKLKWALYDAVRFNWRRIAENKVPHLYVSFTKDIGASRGKPAHYARFDLDYTKFEVHSHPIQPEEKPADEMWLGDLDSDLWPGYDDFENSPTIDEEIEFILGDDP
jgi:hypothetical protein